MEEVWERRLRRPRNSDRRNKQIQDVVSAPEEQAEMSEEVVTQMEDAHILPRERRRKKQRKLRLRRKNPGQ